MYVKIFQQIFDSSLADNYLHRLVFMDMLNLADVDGVVDITHEAISRRANVPIEIVREAIVALESPDARSRSKDFEGARIKRLDEHRDWGWMIVNYPFYRQLGSREHKREKTLKRVRKHRAKCNADVTPCNADVTKSNACNDKERERKKYKKKEKDKVGRGAGDNTIPLDPKKWAHEAPQLTDGEWLESLKSNPAYIGLDVGEQYGRMCAWCDVNHKTTSRRRFVNWLNRADKPLNASLRPGMRPVTEEEHERGF